MRRRPPRSHHRFFAQNGDLFRAVAEFGQDRVGVFADAGRWQIGAGAVVAPFPAVVAEVLAEPGQTVDGADPIVVIEAMKMLHTLTAGGPGVVAEVRVTPGEQVATNQILITFQENDTEENEE